jgi:hypothetical protein
MMPLSGVVVVEEEGDEEEEEEEEEEVGDVSLAGFLFSLAGSDFWPVLFVRETDIFDGCGFESFLNKCSFGDGGTVC